MIVVGVVILCVSRLITAFRWSDSVCEASVPHNLDAPEEALHVELTCYPPVDGGPLTSRLIENTRFLDGSTPYVIATSPFPITVLTLEVKNGSKIEKGALASLKNVSRLNVVSDDSVACCSTVPIPKGELKRLASLESLEFRRVIVSEEMMNEIRAGHSRVENISFVEVIPRNFGFSIFRGMGSLVKLHIAGQRVTVERDALEGFTNLEELLLPGNSIRDIPRGFFSKVKKLKIVSLEWNEITTLSVDVWRGMRSVRELFLGDNWISALERAALREMPNLEVLSVVSNQISSLEPDTFSQNKKLKVLVLSNNSLARLPDSIFNDLPQLEYVDLKLNRLSALPKRLFEKTVKLKFLDLSGNSLTNIRADAFKSVMSLKSLYLVDNGISHIAEGTFVANRLLEGLDLGGNQLSTLTASMFRGLGSLKWLNVAANNISAVERGTFVELVHLRSLDLACNPLRALPDGLFDRPGGCEMTELTLPKPLENGSLLCDIRCCRNTQIYFREYPRC